MASSRSPCRTSAPSAPRFCRAHRTATGSTSLAHSRTPVTAAAIAAPMAPVPQHRSSTMAPGRVTATAARTNASVRRRGTNTRGCTITRTPAKSAQPTTCSSGAPRARRDIISSSVAGSDVVASSTSASSSAKTQPASRRRATMTGLRSCRVTDAPYVCPSVHRGCGRSWGSRPLWRIMHPHANGACDATGR